MSPWRRHLPLVTRIALWLMLAVTVVPTMAQVAMHAGAPAALGEICSASTSAPSGSGAPVPGAMLGHLQHCPFCAPAEHLAPPRVSTPPALAAAPAEARPPASRAASPRDAAFAWLATLKHGPPTA